MKNLCITCAVALLTAVAVNAQQAVIPAVPTANNAQKSNFTTNTTSDDSAFNHIRILPNLAVGRITLIVDDANTNINQQGECVVYNSGGVLVAQSPFTTGTTDIFVNNFPAGMYYIRLIQKNGQAAVRKFIMMK